MIHGIFRLFIWFIICVIPLDSSVVAMKAGNFVLLTDVSAAPRRVILEITGAQLKCIE